MKVKTSTFSHTAICTVAQYYTFEDEHTFQLVGWLLIVFSLIKQRHVGSIRTAHQIFLILFSDRNMCHYKGCLALKPQLPNL